MRECDFCVAQRGAAVRVYEAIAAQCVPVVVADSFVFPFGLGAARSSGGGGRGGGGGATATSGGVGGSGSGGGGGGGGGGLWAGGAAWALRVEEGKVR